MSLANFSIIVAIDAGGGISKEGEMPWKSRSDMTFFRDTTMGHRRNAIIMGRVTYESIPKEHRPLRGRHCIVISRTLRQEENPEITVSTSLLEALQISGGRSYEEVFIAGGEQIYEEAVRNFLYLCRKIYVTKFKTDYECDLFFPWESIKDFPEFRNSTQTRDFIRYIFAPQIDHQEYQYLNLLKKVMDEGESKIDRTGIGTVSTFGARMEFDISERIPILTTKKVNFDNIIKELLFFVSGKTDTNILRDQGVKIWVKNTTREFLDERGLTDWEEGDMGAGYGFQWRHWGAKYEGADTDYREQGIDQLTTLVQQIKENPQSRRHILSTWNVSDLDKMVLPPCHCLVQFNVSGDRKHLDCQLYQRSGDLFLGVPYNIASYSFLTCMIGHLTGLRPRKLIHIIGDAHIYNNHCSQVRKQITRIPHPFPTLKFRKSARIHNIDDFEFDSFLIQGYTSWPSISAQMAI